MWVCKRGFFLRDDISLRDWAPVLSNKPFTSLLRNLEDVIAKRHKSTPYRGMLVKGHGYHGT
jgi:hypothetical protein